MLAEKPWKLEAIMRLGLGLIVSLFIAGAARLVVQAAQGSPAENEMLFIVGAIGTALSGGIALFALGKPWDSLEFSERKLLLLFLWIFGTFFFTVLTLYAFGQQGSITTIGAVVGTVVPHLVLIGMMPRFLRQHQTTWREAFGFRANWPMAVACGVLGALIFLPLGRLLQMVSVYVMSRSGMTPEVQPAVQMLQQSSTLTERILMAVVTVVSAPIAEEILFRGILYPAAKRMMHPRLALWVVAVVFGAIHFNMQSFLPLVLLAILLARLYDTTGNLLASITVHVCFNAINFALLFGESWLPDKLRRLWLFEP